jgi:cbb3-type cytochrome oxidase maturation protein
VEILYLLIPLSVVLIFFILGALWWAIDRGQFDDVDREAERILEYD